MRLIRRLAIQNAELRESRAAHAEAAALAERGRVARELHDVLAHSLSALALQLEGTRLLARDRGADPEVVEDLERAHRLAASGLTEARQAIAALRGDDLPDLRDLADTFPGATLTVTGEPREPSSEARLALYRTAQEALTNVRRHSASEQRRAAARLREDGTTLTVQDHGAERPVRQRPRLRADRHARARRAARRPPDRRPDRRRLPGGAVAAAIRVLLADDQRVVREGLGTLLGLLDGIELVGTAADGEEALALAAEHAPDVVLMDLRMPRMDGIEAIRRLTVPAIALTTYADDASVLGALRAGARGYLTKDAGAEHIRARVSRPSPAARRCSTRRSSTTSSPRSTTPPAPPDDLTPREAEVLGLIAEGLTNAEIAERLVVSTATVKSHVNHIFAKIGARDRAQAVVYAYATG